MVDGVGKFIDIENIIHLFQIITLLGSYIKSGVSSAVVNMGRVRFPIAELTELQIILSTANARIFKLLMWDIPFIYNTEGTPKVVSSASRQPKYFTETQQGSNNHELVSKTTKFDL